ncbi:hypothetical protein SLEP1_g46398 [Rubroshorea leprosula]|uniref:C2 DOCK-type domain-containing protein n=1 Tax=Rubroshorea leprosula TaxID=152421 RepID=A0AAV5LMR6_9ROSI|nr:hypothetical protein SLEP1_g46398 [Rubroshorea leprosula]
MYPREPGLSLQKWAHTQVAVGVACYHDEIKASLPTVWTPLHHLLFTFFHVDLQMKLEAPKPVALFFYLAAYIICSATGVIGMVVHGHFPGLCCGYLDDINSSSEMLSEENNDLGGDQGEVLGLNLKSLKILLKQGVFIWAMLCCLLFFACKRVLAAEGLVNAEYGVIKVSLILKIFKEQGVILIALLDAIFVTRVVNIGTTALVTNTATTIFGEAGVAIFHLTGITPKSIAVHNPKEGAGYVDMIETVLEIKDTHVREVMTPLVDVVATDASATLVDFNHPWVTHQYSRVPVFEQRVDNIVGLAYAMDVLDFARKGEQLESSTMGDMAHKPAYFVPGNP